MINKLKLASCWGSKLTFFCILSFLSYLAPANNAFAQTPYPSPTPTPSPSPSPTDSPRPCLPACSRVQIQCLPTTEEVEQICGDGAGACASRQDCKMILSGDHCRVLGLANGRYNVSSLEKINCDAEPSSNEEYDLLQGLACCVLKHEIVHLKQEFCLDSDPSCIEKPAYRTGYWCQRKRAERACKDGPGQRCGKECAMTFVEGVKSRYADCLCAQEDGPGCYWRCQSEKLSLPNHCEEALEIVLSSPPEEKYISGGSDYSGLANFFNETLSSIPTNEERIPGMCAEIGEGFGDVVVEAPIADW